MAVIAAVFSRWVIWKSDWDLLLIAIAILLTSIPLYPFYKGRLHAHAAELAALEAGQEA
jgi:hypothetical protein